MLSSSWNRFLVRIDSCLVAIVRPNLSTPLCSSSPTYTQTLHDLHIRFGLVFTLEREYFFYRNTPILRKKFVWCVTPVKSFCLYNQFWGSPEKKKKKKKKRKKTEKRKEKRGLFVVLLHYFRWCVVTSFVPRLASLARSRLGPAQYHRWTIIQLASVTNVVLVLPCFSPPIAPHISTTAWQVLLLRHRYTSLHGCRLVGCRHLLFGLVRTCKGLF